MIVLVIVALAVMLYASIQILRWTLWYESTEEYTCGVCQTKFRTDWPEEAALIELHEKFGAYFEAEDCAVVCDDCYKRLGYA